MQVKILPEYKAIPTTASIPSASRLSISCCVVMPPATASRREVACRIAFTDPHRDSPHQAFGVDVRVEKSFAEGFECANHVERGDCSLFAPAVDRNPAASRIEGKYERRAAECSFPAWQRIAC